MSLPNLPFSTLVPFCRPDVFSLFLPLKLLFAFSLLPHKSPSLTSHLPMLQAISDHSIRLPEYSTEPLVDHLILPLVVPRSAFCPQTLVPSSSCDVSAPACPSSLQSLSSHPRQHRVALKPSLHIFAGLYDAVGPRRRLSMSISGRYPFPSEYFTVATGLGQSCDDGRYGPIPEARKKHPLGTGFFALRGVHVQACSVDELTNERTAAGLFWPEQRAGCNLLTGQFNGFQNPFLMGCRH